MDGIRLADRLAYGAGCAARRVGFLHDAFRPSGKTTPIDVKNRFMQLNVAFVLPDGGASEPPAFAVPFRQALADWSYLRVGDYLVGPEGTAFVASIEPPKPMLVIMSNTYITLVRPASANQKGLNHYGAVLPQTEIPLISGYPASLLVGGIGIRVHNGLPDDNKVPGFTALFPVIENVSINVNDILINGDDMRFTVNSVEESCGIWRLSVVQAVR